MAPSDPPSAITLRIKVAPGHIADSADEYTLGTSVPTNASIGQVRSRIQQILPTHPSVERQRILYGGRALVDNEQSLADALNTKRDPTQTEYVIHLLVKGDGTEASVTPQHRSSNTTPQPRPHSGAEQTNAQPAPNVEPNQPLPQHQPHNVHQHFHHGLPHGLHLHGHAPQMPPNLVGGLPFNAPLFMRPPGFNMPMMMPNGQFAHGPGGPGANAGRNEDGSVQNATAPGTDQGQTTTEPNSTAITSEQQSTQHQHQHGGHGIHVQGVGANGERFAIHHQTLNFPNFALPGHGAPFGNFGLPQPLGVQAPAPAPAPVGTSALDRNRQNISNSMNDLEALQNMPNVSEEQRQVIARLRERTQMLSEYIDPFNLGTRSGARAALGELPSVTSPLQQLLQATRSISPMAGERANRASQQSPSDATCFLLSSPTGPQAILYTPQHGLFTNATMSPLLRTASVSRNPTPTPTTQPENPDAIAQAQAQPEARPAGAEAPAEFQQQAAAGDELRGPMDAIMASFWLLLRVLIFVYFLLGSNMGWRRPLILIGVGLGFWVARALLFGDGRVMRRWWDGIVQVPQAAAAAAPNQAIAPANDGQAQPLPQQEAGAAGGNDDAAGRRRAAMLTPEEFARRLLDRDRRERRERDERRRHWLRETIRPVERAFALFVASLWPGVGEAHVRAREAEERRRREEEAENNRLAAEAEAEREAARLRDLAEGQEKDGKGEGTAAAAGEGGEKGSSASSAGEKEKVEFRTEEGAGTG